MLSKGLECFGSFEFQFREPRVSIYADPVLANALAAFRRPTLGRDDTYLRRRGFWKHAPVRVLEPFNRAQRVPDDTPCTKPGLRRGRYRGLANT
jgi:hypothetical protein